MKTTTEITDELFEIYYESLEADDIVLEQIYEMMIEEGRGK